MPKITTKTLTLTALLAALEIVLSRFLSISAWNTKIGFAFVPVVLAALLLGPLQAGIVAALADFLGALLFPVGPYFPGFTLTAFLMGLCYGLFLYKKQSFLRILLAVAVHQLALSLLLNALYLLTAKLRPQPLLKAVMELRLMSISGWSTRISWCSSCNPHAAGGGQPS